MKVFSNFLSVVMATSVGWAVGEQPPGPMFHYHGDNIYPINDDRYEVEVLIEYTVPVEVRWYCSLEIQRGGYTISLPGLSRKRSFASSPPGAEMMEIRRVFSTSECSQQGLRIYVHSLGHHELRFLKPLSSSGTNSTHFPIEKVNFMEVPPRSQVVQTGSHVTMRLRVEVEDANKNNILPFDGFYIARHDLHIEKFNDVRFDMLYEAGQAVKPLKDMGIKFKSEVEKHGTMATVAMVMDINTFDPKLHYGVYMIQARFGPMQAYALTSLWPEDIRTLQIEPKVTMETCSFQSSSYTSSEVRLYQGSPDCLQCTVIGMDIQDTKISLYQNDGGFQVLLNDVENILNFPYFQRILYQMVGSSVRDTGVYTCVAEGASGSMTLSKRVKVIMMQQE